MATKKTKAPSNRESLVVASKIKEYIRGKGFQSSSEVAPALSDRIYSLLDETIERTESNGRATVRPYDL